MAESVEANGGQTADHVREFNAARYDYILAITNGFVDAYNADRFYDYFGRTAWEDANEHFFYVVGRMIYAFEPNVAASFEQHAAWYPVSQAEIQSAFQEISQEWTQSGLSPAAAEERTRSTMTSELEEWSRQQTLSSLAAFQIGARNNFEMATELGYVVEIEEPHYSTLATSTNRETTREMTLGDLGRSAPSWLAVDEDILQASLDPTGQEFLAPETILDSPYVRNAVEEFFEPLTELSNPSAEEFAAATQEVVKNQLSRAYLLADMFDELPVMFPYLFDSYSGDYLYYFEDFEDRKLKRAVDWRGSDGLLDYDAIRASQFADTPRTALREHGSTIIERTVQYSSIDSAPLTGADPVKQQSEFCSVRHLLTGETDWNVTSIVQPAVPTPEASHPAKNATLGPPSQIVEAVTVTPDSEAATTIDVLFPVDFTIAIRHVNEAGRTLPTEITQGLEQVTGPWEGSGIASAVSDEGWKLTSGPQTVGVRFTAEQPEVTFVYKEVSTLPPPGERGEPDDGTKEPVAQTGTHAPFAVAVLAAGLLVTGAVLTAWRHRRQDV